MKDILNQNIDIKCLYGSGLLDQNTYIVTNLDNNESVMIDADIANLNVDSVLEKYNIKAILLTHCHFDHMWSAEEIREKTGAPIYIAKTEKENLASYRINISYFYKKRIETEADFTFEDSDIIDVCGLKFKAILTPGHTSGSACYLINDVMFSGDTLFAGSAGRTDLRTGSYEDLLSSLERLKCFDDSLIVYPGHGDYTNLGFEKTQNPFFRQI